MATVPKFFIQSIPDGGVIARKLAPSSVITSKLAEGAVTPNKTALTDEWDFSVGTLRSGTPATPTEVATKDYVDGRVASGAGGKVVATFAYDSTSSTTALGSGEIIASIKVQMTTAFDDNAATVAVTTGSGTTLLGASDIDAQSTNLFMYLGGFRASATDTIVVTVSPGTSTVGEGYVIIETVTP